MGPGMVRRKNRVSKNDLTLNGDIRIMRFPLTNYDDKVATKRSKKKEFRSSPLIPNLKKMCFFMNDSSLFF